MKTRFALTAAAFALAAMPALAQDLPKTHLKITGGLSNLTAYQDYEVPFWTKTIPAQSKGQITAEIKGFNEMGIKGPELLRLMGSGVIEFGTATLAYFASDNPINEAIDLAGLAPDIKTAREVTQVFEPVYDKLYGQGNNVKLLGISTYPAQVLFCNAEIKSLNDLKGKKVRTSSRTQADFVEALGGASVTMAFGEVVPALDTLLAALDRLVRLQGKILEDSAAEARAIYAFARIQMLVGLAIAIGIGLLLARWVVLSVTRPLGGEPEDVLFHLRKVSKASPRKLLVRALKRIAKERGYTDACIRKFGTFAGVGDWARAWADYYFNKSGEFCSVHTDWLHGTEHDPVNGHEWYEFIEAELDAL